MFNLKRYLTQSILFCKLKRIKVIVIKMLIKNEEVYLTRILNYRQKHDERMKQKKKTLLMTTLSTKNKINALINDFLNKQYNQ